MKIVSGINPSSSKGLHIGNYFGAVKQFIELQSSGHECFFFVANLHSLNSVFNPQEARQNALQVFAQYLSFGIDTDKTTFFLESEVPQIPYLQTILNNCVTVAELQRMHGYKDKLAKDADTVQISAGLFEYPVLMAADILVFGADAVPVGADQAQHLEITREIAKTFNNRYGNILKIPEVKINAKTSKVIGTDGERKMSKSLGNDLPIFATEAEIAKKIMSIKTDPARIKPTDPGDPSKNICFEYLSLLNADSKTIEDFKNRYKAGTIGDVEIKKYLTQIFLEYFKDTREKYFKIKDDMTYLQLQSTKGRQKAVVAANQIFKHILTSTGLDIGGEF